MSSDRNRDGNRNSGHVCDSCRQPVDTVVERHKTMGMYVPRWTAGPCRNPHCERYVPEQALVPPPRVAGTGRRRKETGPPA